MTKAWRKWLGAIIGLGLFAGCVSQAPSVVTIPAEPIAEDDVSPPSTSLGLDGLFFQPVNSSDGLSGMPEWASASVEPALEAFAKSCVSWRRRPLSADISSRAPYAGQVSDWLPICASLESVAGLEEARLILSTLMTPLEVISP